MKRNKNIDIIRGIAILAIIIYHIYAITGISISIEPFQTLLEYGGEYGVTIFFILSGFAIYSSIKNKGESFNYYSFICKRLNRILPQYYISLIILLLFTNMAVFLNYNNIGNIFSHVFLFHDLYPNYQGSISGVCWTLGVIFQFYLISPLLYKLIEKRPIITAITSIIISVSIKAFLFHFILSQAVGVNITPAQYFGLGRTIFTSLDAFVLGMILGKIVKIPENNKKIFGSILGLCISLFAFILWLFVSKKQISFITNNTGIYSDCFVGYIWHSVLSILLFFIIYLFSRIKILFESPVSKFLLFVSKYEYGIYIWHLIMIEALCHNSAIIMHMVDQKNKLLYLLLISLSVIEGAFFSEIFDNINYKNVYLNFKKPIINVCKIGIVVITIFFVSNAFMKIPYTYNNLKIVSYLVLILSVGINFMLVLMKLNIIKKSELLKTEIASFIITSGLIIFSLYMYVLEIIGVKLEKYVFIPIFIGLIFNVVYIFIILIKKSSKLMSYLKNNIKQIYNCFELNKIITIVLILANLSYILYFTSAGLPIIYSGLYIFMENIQENLIKVFSGIFLFINLLNLVSIGKRKKININIILILLLVVYRHYSNFELYSTTVYADMVALSLYTCGLLYFIEWLIYERNNSMMVISILSTMGASWFNQDYLFIFNIAFLIIIRLFSKKFEIEKISLSQFGIYTFFSILPYLTWKFLPKIVGFSSNLIVGVSSKYEIHLDYVMSLMQSIAEQFYSNYVTVAFLGIILSGLVIIYNKLCNKDKKCIKILLINILVYIITLIATYIVAFGEDALSATSFIKYYEKTIMVQLLICSILIDSIIRNINQV